MNNMKKLLLSLSLVLLISLVSAQSFNFVDEVNISAKSNNYLGINDPPNAINPIVTGELDITSNMGLDYMDNNFVSTNNGEWKSSYHIFKAQVNNPISLNWTWEGRNQCIYKNFNHRLYLWNFSSNEWILSDEVGLSHSNHEIINIYTEEIDSFVNNHETYFLVWMDRDSCAGFGKSLETGFVELNTEEFVCPNTNTTLFNEITSIVGDYKNAGDNFQVNGRVTNIGVEETFDTIISLDIPSNWTTPNIHKNLGYLGIGENKTYSYNITRDDEDSLIKTFSSSCNSIPTDSEQIPIPISYFVVVGLALFIGIIGIFQYRRKV